MVKKFLIFLILLFASCVGKTKENLPTTSKIVEKKIDISFVNNQTVNMKDSILIEDKNKNKFSNNDSRVKSKSQIYCVQSVVFGECEIGGSVIDTCLMFDGTENLPQWICDSLSIVQYMNKNVNDDLLAVIKAGKIAFQIIIFDDGRTCCSSITNMANSEINIDVYRDAINKMPKWIPIKKNGIKTKCKISLILDIKNGKFIDKKALPLT